MKENPLQRLWRRIALYGLIVVSLAVGAIAQQAVQPPNGSWQGTMKSTAGEVNFVIDLSQQGGQLHAALLNAGDRQPFTSAAWDGKVLTLRFDYYDGTLTAHFVSPTRMEGDYSRQTSRGVVHIPLTLMPAPENPSGKPWSGPSLAGEWIFHLLKKEGADRDTLAEFQQEKTANTAGQVIATGIFEPVDGDTGLLHGTVYTDDGASRFHLSRFDGIHVLAFDGVFLPDGSLKGQMGGVASLTPFTAKRSSDSALVDPNVQGGTLTRVKDPQEPFRFSGLDANGKTVDQDSPEFKGKAVIVDIFGTWCPNCHDEAPVLESLYRRYHAQGLEIVALAYEYTDDAARNQRLMAIYRAKYGLTFPMLLTGTTADGQIAKTLPQLVDFGAYPTTIFLDRTGRVHAIHAGFSGPSTGQRYTQVQQNFDSLTREVLKPAK
jgi:thiol-disulfide isomerase/thioredoxin